MECEHHEHIVVEVMQEHAGFSPRRDFECDK